MSTPLVVILMGSAADSAHAGKIAEAAAALGLDTVLRVGSAHKSPAAVLAMLADYEADPRSKVYVTVAGRSNALSGLVDGAVLSPVIACPPSSEALGGIDVWSSLRMPSGVAPAFVADPANAALLAAKILRLAEPEIGPRLEAGRESRRSEIEAADRELRARASVAARAEGGRA